MIQYKAFIASSLDGFIARSDGSIDWLTSDEYALENNDLGYSSFIKGIDCIVMGRITFETVLSFESYPYGSLPVYVLTKNPDYKFESTNPISIFNGKLENLTHILEKKQFKTVYVDGGQLIQSFIKEQMLNEITITRIPVLLGSGLPLFGYLPKDQKLKHIKTLTYSNGFVQSDYHLG
ncbi:dihydrofolate reductase [Leptospira sp. 201903074]|uniref:dihydrofolate reductase family protein n=1 Tax=Leptospira abararensis TaxID=2810036 RepID=UPI001964E055|nr:dihydrofolate reductase family protein [Leptospira abararensis]MBM9547841.1 dihydrofolate reductase [Leptospira abararensis]